MSICPNKDLFSAYIDGEVSSPWKEQLQQHIEVCPVCRQVYTQYAAVQRCMQLSSIEPHFDVEKSFAKLSEKRAALLEAKRIAEKQSRENWFSASIRVPVPAAAAAVLIFVLVPLLLFFKMQDTVMSARDSFTPILPVSPEKHLPLAEIDFCSLHTDEMHEYSLPNKALVTNAKIFTVSEFTRLYSGNGDIFRPARYDVDLKILSSRLPLIHHYPPISVSAENISMINDQ
ncbi:MAG: zf-HC2 domain-containing protein [Treponema sp.]